MILACDVGGTKTNIGLFESRGDTLKRVAVQTYVSRSYPSLAQMLAEFLASRPGQLAAAAFGIPGPVIQARAPATNLPWELDAAQLADQLHLRSVALVNDLEAHAWAVDHLGAGDVDVLQEGIAIPGGTTAVIAAGTGLGFSALVRDGGSESG